MRLWGSFQQQAPHGGDACKSTIERGRDDANGLGLGDAIAPHSSNHNRFCWKYLDGCFWGSHLELNRKPYTTVQERSSISSATDWNDVRKLIPVMMRHAVDIDWWISFRVENYWNRYLVAVAVSCGACECVAGGRRQRPSMQCGLRHSTSRGNEDERIRSDEEHHLLSVN